MNVLMLLLAQSMLSDAYAESKLPRFAEEPVAQTEPRAKGEPHAAYPWFGIEPMAVWSTFGSGLHVRDAWGFGADATVTLDYGKGAMLGFRLGCLGWNTRTEPDAGIPAAAVTIRQYRIGIFGEFPVRFLEFGIGANVGGYRFRRDGQNDTAGFFEFQGMIGGRPIEYVWIGIVGMQSFTSSNFNHNGDHFYVNYSIGPAVELRF